jgi:hypothetical protein
MYIQNQRWRAGMWLGLSLLMVAPLLNGAVQLESLATTGVPSEISDIHL